MPKTGNQKLKLLAIIKILGEQTDEEHWISMQELLEELKKLGIQAERKSIYNDLEQLRGFGYRIEAVKARENSGYYLGERQFELPELKLLVDAVQSSRFITLKKSRELIGKLEQLAGKYGAVQLQRQVYVANRIKTDNESIYRNVDSIHRAIQENNRISFQYMEWTLHKQLKPRKEGARYEVSPWALTWKDENYYLIAYDGGENRIKHYRVDKMGEIRQETGRRREGGDDFARFDIAAYTNKTFGMFGGEEKTLTLQFPNRLVGVIIDRFGREADLRPREGDTFSIRANVAVSGQFFGWMAGLGEEARILAPEKVASDYREYLRQIWQSAGGHSRTDSTN